MNPLIDLKPTTSVFIVPIGLAYFWLSPAAQAVSPAPDGGYPGGNTAEGQAALLSLTTGGFNTAVGFLSLRNDTTGQLNTAIGAGTLLANTADQNTAIGGGALLSNTTGTGNTANGAFALFSNDLGAHNTATGVQSLFSNTAGGLNTATGFQALYSNSGTGSLNTADGGQALFNNTSGLDNTANGVQALFSNTTGSYNTASGVSAVFNNISGFYNVAFGGSALYRNGTGNNNTAIGYASLINNIDADNNTAIGYGTFINNASGAGNVALGYSAGAGVTTANNVICIGANVAGADISNTAWVGNVYGVTTQSGTTAQVVVSDTGQLGTVASSERLKKDIFGMAKASEAILSLRPVTFHYKTDTKDTPQFGLIAEEVAKVNPALVLPDKEGKPYSVRYDAVNAMLLNEFLKEHRAFVEEQGKVQEQGATIARLEQQIEALTAVLQKVSAHLEVIKSGPQTVLNNQ
jgi:hypothetical protein